MGWLLVWLIVNVLFFVWRILVTSEVETRERSIRNCRKLPTSDQNVPSLVDDLGRNIQTAEPLARTSVFDLAVFGESFMVSCFQPEAVRALLRQDSSKGQSRANARVWALAILDRVARRSMLGVGR